MLRKEGNVYVVREGTTQRSHGGRRNLSSRRRKRAKETSHVPLQQPNFLTAGGVSVKDRSKRTETASPQLNERCENDKNATVC